MTTASTSIDSDSSLAQSRSASAVTSPMEEILAIWLDCGYLEEGDEPHEFPLDWKFGGANECHPGADPRWEAANYRYLDEFAQTIHVTSVPICDHQALDYFTLVSSWGDLNPRYIEVKYPGTNEFVILPWEYRASTDTVYPLAGTDAN